MVQREVRKKTRIYGTAGFLSAITLVALIYAFGVAPLVFNPAASSIKTFSSYEELKNFLNVNTRGNSYSVYSGGPLDARSFGSSIATNMPVPAPAAPSSAASGSGQSYSTTNIQVAGVDEADIVKTDGAYVYVIANNTVFIVDASPLNARVVAKIAFDNTSLAGLFLSQDSSKLAVFGSQYTYYFYPMGVASPMIAPTSYRYFSSDVSTFIYVFDISAKASPVLARNFTMSGSYFNSRMIGNYVYAVISQPAYVVNDTVVLPQVYPENEAVNISATSVHYTDVVDSYFGFTTFVGLNLADSSSEPNNLTLLTGGASNMYVSLNDVYVTYPSSDGGTSIYKIHVNDGALAFGARGKVPGNVLNQYSMDEFNGYFRLATNAWDYNSNTGLSSQQNNVYVLDVNLTTVGKLENLATGENLHAARFMGDKCYLVTFKKTDPLFVIDLGDPFGPKVLGSLKIPGYSDYLHPYDEDHLIGVGKETVEASQGDFAWYQGLKLALFDVSKVSEPVQLSNFVIGDRGTQSPVLDDPKAFLFDKSRDLLVIPVELFLINRTEVPPGPNAYGTFAWQGVYVFDVTLSGGFVVRGNVTQVDDAGVLLGNPKLAMVPSGYSWWSSDLWISRALFIGDTLFTVSSSRVQLNSLNDFALIAKVDLG